jgi:hypothetical protein
MSTIDMVRYSGEIAGGSWLRRRYARIAATLAGLARVSETKVDTLPAAEAVERAAQLFAQAVREESNLAMDWLWCAAQMTNPGARRYCIERALTLDPDSELARRALAGV